MSPPQRQKLLKSFLERGIKSFKLRSYPRLETESVQHRHKRSFAPIYEVPEDKKKLVTELKKEAKKADMVWLASDEDREGEAISWHLFEVLELDPAKTKRIVFHEITKTAILKAIEHPRDINVDLVNAQQARRVTRPYCWF